MSSKEKFRVVIVDDVSETRENVRKLLQFESDVDIVGTARNGRESIKLCDELNPDVVLMDINMPDMDGITATNIIRKRQPAVQVVILSVQSDQNYMRRASLAGARDFLTKPPMGDELISAIRRAGSMAQSERSKSVNVSLVRPLKQTPNLAHLLFEEKGLKLTLFDLSSRLSLYQESRTDGKLVDEVEILVAGLAHDIRSPISIILSILDTIQSDDERTMAAIKKIRRRCLHCKWVADNFLGISLSEKISVRVHSLKSIVEEIIELLENRIHPGIKLDNTIDENVSVSVDPGLVSLVLMNIISNALESIPETGRISINVDGLKDQTAIFIEDDGEPILEPSIRQLFRLGFTTKEAHVGIGLYVSKRLLKQQNGDLYFARDFRTGTKMFGIRLPTPMQETGSDNPNDVIQRIHFLKANIEHMNRELAKYRNAQFSATQLDVLSKEFQRMTSTFSKNLNNELLLIEATILDAIQKLPPEDESTETAFRKIIRNCAYCRLLTSNILALGEGVMPQFEDISLIDIVEEVLSLVDRKMPTYLYTVEWNVDPFLPNIKADALQMKQVFMNLIKNALDSMPYGGTLTIKLTMEAGFVIVEVGDTGTGITRANLARLFQLGFTTKQKGYGIGLFSIKKIIEGHGGQIDVASVWGEGTTFKIWLPVETAGAK